MPIREFRDPEGRTWQAWRVVPTLAAPSAERRRLVPPEPILERRRRRATAKEGLAPELHTGWLCFDGPGEKRRLHPVPLDWERCTEPELLGYWRAATVVPPPRA